MTALTIAAAQYPIEEPASLAAFLEKERDWIDAGAASGADLLVFPEYGGAEALAIFGRAANRDLLGATERLQDALPTIDDARRGLARRLGVHILAGSAPERGDDGRYRNVARLYAPEGGVGRQEKLILTPYAREAWRLSAGAGRSVFGTAIGRVGVAICYDVEFPLIARALREAGADILLAPSCTDTVAGYWRVRIGAMARALENQCVVVQSPTVGRADWTPALDVNRGAAGVFLPPDRLTAADGVAALGTMDAPGWTTATVDLARLAEVRVAGEVRNDAHWAEQSGAPAAILPLR